jgi:hypothetical protein
MSWPGKDAVIRRKQSWAQLMSFATGQRLGSSDFEGGKAGAVRVLGQLGFIVEKKNDD